MARTHSSYTPSPVRHRSPLRSPARRPSSEDDGSQYEMDLDALGMGSTFESSGIDNHAPQIDVVDTSDIDGPDDFTMNMTYYMTADLQQVKSRKEASANVREVRGDMRTEDSDTQESTAEGEKAVLEDFEDGKEKQDSRSGSPTARVDGGTDVDGVENVFSDSSMENEEKVMSYLSALPDTDALDLATSTPLRMKQNLLQVPNQSPPKARSLQPTVEDYDTPRKPTQETVIHHVQDSTAPFESTEQDDLHAQISELQRQLEEQEISSRTRITQLETIQSFTKSELETARTDSYKQKERIHSLEQDLQRQSHDQSQLKASLEEQLKRQEEELSARMQDFGEELRLQNLAKLQKQKDAFEKESAGAAEAKRAYDAQLVEKDILLEQLRGEILQLQRTREQELANVTSTRSDAQQNLERDLEAEKRRIEGIAREHANELETLKSAHANAQKKSEQTWVRERDELNARFSSLQARASSLQTDLEKATTQAKAAREEAQAATVLLSSTREASATQSSRISELETRLQILQKQLDAAHADATSKDQQIFRNIEDQEVLEQRLSTAHGRMEGLETTISTLRQQLSESHRESSKARTDVDRLQSELEETSDRLQEARMESDRKVADAERKLSRMKETKAEMEICIKELQTEHSDIVEDRENALEEVRSKAEDAVRKAGTLLEQERAEKKRLAKELRSQTLELEQLRSEAARKLMDEEECSDEEPSSLHTDPRDAEIENLRTLLRKHASTMKTLKSDISTLRKEKAALKTTSSSARSLENELTTLRTENTTLTSEITTLRTEISTVRAEAETRRLEHEAVNKAMDERLAEMLRKIVKDKTKAIIGKRDEQWIDSVERLQSDKELRGQLLLREWGRQEVGVADEQKGEKQRYRYKYVQRA